MQERLHRDPETNPGGGNFPHEAALRLRLCLQDWLTGRQYLNLAGWKKQVEQFFPTGPRGNYRKTVA